MAWVQGIRKAIFEQVDSGGNVVHKTFVLTSADDATAVTDAAAILAALEAVSALTTRSYRITNQLDNDAWTLAAAGVQAEAKAVIICQDDTVAMKMHTLEISGPETDVFVATTGVNSNVVDIAHADVVTFCNLYDTTGEATISDGESIEPSGLVRGYRRTASKRHG